MRMLPLDVWSNKVGQIKKQDNWSDSDSGRNIQKEQESRLKSYGHEMRGHLGRRVMAMDVSDKRREGQPKRMWTDRPMHNFAEKRL